MKLNNTLTIFGGLFLCLSIGSQALAGGNPYRPGYHQNNNPYKDGYVQRSNPYADGYVQNSNP